jgi:hypothetical protein
MRIFETCGSVRRQPAKAAAEPSRFHPITVVVSPRRGSGDPAKPLFYPGRGSGTPKRLSFRLDAAAAGRQKRFYHPDAAAAAPNDCHLAWTPQRQANKTAFITRTRRRHAKTTFVLPAAPKFSADSPDFRRFSLQTINHQLLTND